jgi:haloalkane dehalogenase
VPILGKLLVRGLNGFAAPAVWMSMNQRKLSKDEQKGYLLPYSNWDDRVAVNAFVQDIPLELNHPSRPTLAFIEQNLSRFKTNPKLIVWGGRDFCFNDHFRDRWLKIFPGATVHYFPNCGHYILDDGGAPVRTMVSEFVLGA